MMASTSVDVRAFQAGGRLALRVGELVEVRTQEEILATLDDNGELESLPFMPEMLQFCGQRLAVDKVANKLCDTMTGTGMRSMTGTGIMSRRRPRLHRHQHQLPLPFVPARGADPCLRFSSARC